MLEKSSNLLVLALIALLPVLFLPFSWATIPHVKMLLVAACVALGALAWISAQLSRGSITLPRSNILLAGAVLPLVYTVSALFGGSPDSFVGSGVARDTVAAMVLWFASMALVAVAFTNGRIIIRACNTLLAVAGIVIIVQLLHSVIGLNIFGFGGQLVGPAASVIGSWHDLGIFLGLVALLSAALIGTNAVTGVSRWLPRIILPLSLLFLIVVNQQDVWIALATIAALGALYLGGIRYRSAGQRGWRMPFIVLTLVAVFAGVFAAVGTTVHDALPEPLRISQVEVRPSWEGTFTVGSAVYQERNMLLGSGPNTFARQWGFFKPAGVNETNFWNAQFVQGVGFIPTSLVTVGIAGGIAWALFFFVFLYRGFRSLWSAQVEMRWRLLLFALFAGSAYLWTLHVIYSPGVALLALAFVTTGLFIALQTVAGTREARTWRFGESSYTAPIAVGAVVPVVILVFISGIAVARAVVADMYVNRSIIAFQTTGDVDQAHQELDRAFAIGSSQNSRALRTAVELNMARFSQLASETDDTEASVSELQTALSTTIQSGLSAVSANSTDYQSWLTLARVYEQLAGVQVEGAYENAQEAYNRAAAENPTNPVPHVQLARLAAFGDDVEAARTHLDEALRLRPNHAPAHMLRSQIESSAGNLEVATGAAVEAARAAPREPLVWFQIGALSYAAENYEDAAVALEQAVTLNANYSNALYVLGLTYAALERPDDAVRVFERVADLNPGNEEVASMIEQVRAGDPLEAGEEAQ